MSAVLLYLALCLVILGQLYLLASWIRSEVSRQIDEQQSLELERLRAVHAIKDEMKASSHRLLAAAIDPELGNYRVVDAGDFDPPNDAS